jgi:hypothetical protein
MQRLLLLLLIFIISGKLCAQADRFVITKPDSTTSFYAQLQTEIKNRSIGIFRDTVFYPDHSIRQITKYTNFEAPTDTKLVWTIIDKYEFGSNHQLEKMEHWKTDNISRICKCGDWQYRTKGALSLRRPFPNCNKKEFQCDANGDPVK